jgi:hypothetical protein
MVLDIRLNKPETDIGAARNTTEPKTNSIHWQNEIWLQTRFS